MLRQGVMSVTQNDFREMIYLKEGICESEYITPKVRCEKLPKFRR